MVHLYHETKYIMKRKTWYFIFSCHIASDCPQTVQGRLESWPSLFVNFVTCKGKYRPLQYCAQSTETSESKDLKSRMNNNDFYINILLLLLIVSKWPMLYICYISYSFSPSSMKNFWFFPFMPIIYVYEGNCISHH